LERFAAVAAFTETQSLQKITKFSATLSFCYKWCYLGGKNYSQRAVIAILYGCLQASIPVTSIEIYYQATVD